MLCEQFVACFPDVIRRQRQLTPLLGIHPLSLIIEQNRMEWNTLFLLEGTYNDRLVQLPDLFRADQKLMHIIKSIVQMSLKHRRFRGMHCRFLCLTLFLFFLLPRQKQCGIWEDLYYLPLSAAVLPKGWGMKGQRFPLCAAADSHIPLMWDYGPLPQR